MACGHTPSATETSMDAVSFYLIVWRCVEYQWYMNCLSSTVDLFIICAQIVIYCDYSVHVTSKIYIQIAWSNYMLHHVDSSSTSKNENWGSTGRTLLPYFNCRKYTFLYFFLFSAIFLGALQPSLGISLFANSVPNDTIVCISSGPSHCEGVWIWQAIVQRGFHGHLHQCQRQQKREERN